MRRFSFFLLLIILSCKDNDLKPNIVWIMSEDNSIHYINIYNERGINMPSLNSLANDGVIFNNAFSNSPVCSVARTTLITGVYAPRIGTQYHHTRSIKKIKLPKNIKPLPTYLKNAGYYTTNNNKEDYNFEKEGLIWDDSSSKATYKNRKEGEPFFHVVSFGNTHEGQLHFNNKHLELGLKSRNLDSITPLPYHPDTPTFRYTESLIQSRHLELDILIGEVVKDLEKDGLLEDTFIFYFADHGGALPRSKGYLYETGINVPLIIRIPEKWKKLSPFKKNTRTSAFIDFVDFVPTVLSLAGIEVPENLDGTKFMGRKTSKNKIENQNTTFSYADRFDEKYDMVRSIRKGKFKYIRNFQPFNVDGLYNFYRYKMLAYKEWYNMFHEGKLNNIQSQFFKTKLPEALYNIEDDPYETKNLANQVNYFNILSNLRNELTDHLISINDLSFLPEFHLINNANSDIESYSYKNKDLIKKLINISNLSLYDYDKVSSKIKDALNDDNPWIRYWGLIVSSIFGNKALENKEKINYIFENDSENVVKMRAAEYMILNDIQISESKIISLLENSKYETEACLMLNTIALIKTKNPNYKLNFNTSKYPNEWLKDEKDLVNRRVNYITENE